MLPYTDTTADNSKEDMLLASRELDRDCSRYTMPPLLAGKDCACRSRARGPSLHFNRFRFWEPAVDDNCWFSSHVLGFGLWYPCYLTWGTWGTYFGSGPRLVVDLVALSPSIGFRSPLAVLGERLSISPYMYDAPPRDGLPLLEWLEPKFKSIRKNSKSLKSYFARSQQVRIHGVIKNDRILFQPWIDR